MINDKVISERFKYLDEHCCVEVVLNQYHCLEFSEFVVDSGGDVSTYRVYGETKSDFTIRAK